LPKRLQASYKWNIYNPKQTEEYTTAVKKPVHNYFTLLELHTENSSFTKMFKTNNFLRIFKLVVTMNMKKINFYGL